MGKGVKKLNPIPAVGAGIALVDIGKAAGENARQECFEPWARESEELHLVTTDLQEDAIADVVGFVS